MLQQRIMTAILGIPLIFFIFYFGGIPLLLVSLVVVLMGLHEFFRLSRQMDFRPLVTWGYLIGILILFGTYFNYQQYLGFFVWAVFLFFLVYFILAFPRLSLNNIGITVLGVYYVAGLFSYLIWIRVHMSTGLTWVLLIFLLTWANDTGAFFIGTKFGKRRLSPGLSPKKSLEGAAGGLVFSLAVALLFTYFTLNDNFLSLGFLGILVSIFGTIGDLIESGFKRLGSAKDSGALLPGHGGILDRLDSLLLVSPLVYYYLQLFKLY